MFTSATGVTLAQSAKGSIAPIAKGGKSASAGARKNTNRSTDPGAKTSLKNDFTPSAISCGSPLSMRSLRRFITPATGANQLRPLDRAGDEGRIPLLDAELSVGAVGKGQFEDVGRLLDGESHRQGLALDLSLALDRLAV